MILIALEQNYANIVINMFLKIFIIIVNILVKDIKYAIYVINL